MFRLPELRRLFRLPTPRPEEAAGHVDTEVEFHLAMRIEELKARGLSDAEARTEAARRFGNVERARAELAAADRATAERISRAAWFGDLARDLRFAARELGRQPSFTFIAVVVLGLGIGLTTTMVSLFDRLALHPLPYPNADRLGNVQLASGSGDHGISVTPDRAMRDVVARTSGVERVYSHTVDQVMVEVGDTPDVAASRMVSVGLLDDFGARVLIGRRFAPEDTAAGPLTTILSHATWQRRFGGRPDILGRTVKIEGRVATIIGVLQPGFDLTSIDGRARAEFWLPLRSDLLPPGQDRTSLIVRRAPGTAMAALTRAIDAGLKAANPAEPMLKHFHAEVQSAEDLVGSGLRRTLSLFLAAVGLVLLVACANIAALLLGQAAGRAQEFGVRAALGAGRSRVVRQLLAESGLLGLLGAGTGVAVTVGMLALARKLRPDNLLTIDEVAVNGTTLAIAAAIALASALIFGLAPIWAVTRADAATALVGRARRSHDGRHSGRLRSALVTGQIALTLILLVGAGLLVKSFVKQRTREVGITVDGLAQVEISLPERNFPTPARREQVIQDLVARIRRIPGVTGVAPANDGPTSFGAMQAEFLPEGKPWPDTPEPTFMPTRVISPEYFAVAGQRLVAGTTFHVDTSSRENLVNREIIIDEATARRVWGRTDVVGRRIRMSRDAKDEGSTIIGVAADVHTNSDAFFVGVPMIYFPRSPGEAGVAMVVRLTRDDVLTAVSRAVRDTDPGLRIRSATTVADALAEAAASDRFTMAIIAFFSIVALVLASVGLYGVIAFAVRQRQFEFGVRLAIGALPERVRLMVLREGILRIGGGVILGLLGSAALVRTIRSMLFQTSPWDGSVFIGAGLLITVVGIAAAWIPAVRASRVDPLVAIRSE